MVRTTAGALALTLALGVQGAAAQGTGGAYTSQVRLRYIVKDVPSSVAFYRDELGFQVRAQAGPNFAALARGDVWLLLSPIQGPGGASRPMPDGTRPAPGGWNRLVIYTPDLKGEVARLRKDGVHFRNDIVYGLGGNEILLDDPSGNPVELFQPG